MGLREVWRGAMTIGLMCQFQTMLFVVLGKLGWPRWCRGELGESSAGDGMGIFVTGAVGGAPGWPAGTGMGVEGLVPSEVP